MTPRPPRRRPLAAGSLVVAGAVLLAGCGGSPGSAGSTSSPGGTPGSSASTPTRAPAPATGPLLDVEPASMHAPAGWKPMRAIMSFQRTARDPAGGGTASIGFLPAAPGDSLEELARNTIEHGSYGTRRPKPAGTVTINGIRCYKVAGVVSTNTYDELYGTVVGSNEVTISFTFFTKFISPSERRRVVESALASVDWK